MWNDDLTLPKLMRQRFVLAMGCVLLTGASAQTDPLLDFRYFQAPQNAQSPLVVRWLVRSDAQNYCQAVSHKEGYASRSEGCSYWVVGQGQCTVVTTDSTTHSQLGHLYLSCLNAR